MEKAIFLDRDGTINRYGEYIYKADDFVFIDGAIDFIRKFNRLGYKIFVVSNQAGIGRGYYTEKDLYKLENWVNTELAKSDAFIDDWFYCPHHPLAGIGNYKKDCDCRKPKTGMLEKAIKKYNVDVINSFMVGDKEWDAQCGERLGIKSFLLENEDYIALESKIITYLEIKDYVKYSIVIVNNDSFECVNEFCKALSDVVINDYELIIADNCSNNNELKKIRSQYPMARILSFTQKYDMDEINRFAIKYSFTDKVYFINDLKKAKNIVLGKKYKDCLFVKKKLSDVLESIDSSVIITNKNSCDLYYMSDFEMKNGKIIKKG